MEEPLLSIITVTWNAASVIVPTLESVRQQSWHDFEHIIVDGASTDDTLALVHAHGLERTRILSERDKGLCDAIKPDTYLVGECWTGLTTIADYYRSGLRFFLFPASFLRAAT